MKEKKMKEMIVKEYFKRARKIIKSKLNGINCITAINSRSISITRYVAGIIEYIEEEVENLD